MMRTWKSLISFRFQKVYSNKNSGNFDIFSLQAYTENKLQQK